MDSTLKRCLEDLSSRIDENVEEELRKDWVDFLEDRCGEGYWEAPRRTPKPAKADWPTIMVNDALKDPTAMLLQQFKMASDVLAAGGHEMLNVRCNYGTVIIPRLFGCKLHLMEQEQNCLPGNLPLENEEAIQRAIDGGVPDLTKASGEDVFGTGAYFLEVLEQYPVLKRWVSVYHPDLQGPIDNAETIWGSDIFYALYDQPERVKALLRLITDTYIAFMEKWIDLVGQPKPYNVHWGVLHKGFVVLRNDSLMNLSPEVYVDFVRPLDQEIFDRFGGGFVHYCGRGEHFVPAMSEMNGLYALNLSQPHLNDMEVIFRNTVDKGIMILGLDMTKVTTEWDLKGRVFASIVSS